jgi:acetylornithine/LysW-gamma-L-lysine aminotransferase
MGARVWDENGHEYIDCVAGYGVANLGHCHPAVVAAVKNQAAQLITCPEVFHNDQRARLVARLTALAPGEMQRVFLSNSGAEAVEAGLKFARISTGRTEVISTLRSFHGRTMGALTLTGQKQHRVPFEPLLPDVTQIPYNNIEALRAAISERTAAVILEVVQGEGGVRLADADYLRAAQRMCYQRGALLILDEVQTGLGRTGRMFACEHYDLEPDILCLAKSLAGGLPMGATLLGPRVSALPTGAHGSTFGGNPLACAAALAVLEVLETEKLPERTAQLGEQLVARLQAADLPLVRAVRGLGLMIGVELKQKVTPLLRALQARSVLALPAGKTVLRLLPPLVISADEWEQVSTTLLGLLRGSTAEN